MDKNERRELFAKIVSGRPDKDRIMRGYDLVQEAPSRAIESDDLKAIVTIAAFITAMSETLDDDTCAKNIVGVIVAAFDAGARHARAEMFANAQVAEEKQ